ncbi:MAG TPA: ABC transporter ATP-binding protein [Symbiobacteriaceae bacterium]|nr:ABC transporter ATP-binding protein [Symbiobacteriaceae bacterium]
MAVLETVGLTKRFGSLVAVDDLSLQVEAGEVFGFLGPNGAGKTTSIHMMCGLLKPDAGQTLIHGRPVAGEDADTRARVGVCPQQIVLWPTMTCLEQLEFIGEMYGVSRAEARRRGDALLDDMGLTDKRDMLAKNLSGGMQRRLNLAMALVHDPEILVLDEPEAGLDPQSRVLIREFVRSLARKKTVILTTHNMDEAERLADRVAIIDHGRLLTVDTPEELKRQAGPGDVLEIELPGAGPEEMARARGAVAAAVSADVGASGSMLTVRARAMVELLPAVLAAVKTAGLATGAVHIRQNTLEDVFIAMTGRRLRE